MLRLISSAQIAAELGVTRAAVNNWMRRYPADHPTPFPQPDAIVEGPVRDTPAWLPHRLDEIRQWLGK